MLKFILSLIFPIWVLQLQACATLLVWMQVLFFWISYLLLYTRIFFPSLLTIDTIYQDSLSFFIIITIILVFLISLCFITPLIKDLTLFLTYSALFVTCLIVFSSRSIFIIYFFYELALLPILYIILKWGVYPDRLVRSLILLIYTSFFTFPLLWCLVSYYYFSNRLLLLSSPSYLVTDFFIILLVSLSFLVKLPVYGLHLWLPIAHVEAPTIGSIILAGVLLKLGGVGLIRFSLVFKLEECFIFFLSYLLVSLLYVTVVCRYQSDFKRIVAYSSVSHMIVVPILLLANNILSFKCLVLVIFLHGLSSPLLFSIVGVLHLFIKTRQLVVLKNTTLLNPLFAFLCVLGFIFSVAAPPFPSFTVEVFTFFSCFCLTSLAAFVLRVYVFLSIRYRLLWLVPVVVLSKETSPYVSPRFFYIWIIPIFRSLLIGFFGLITFVFV